MSFGTFFYSTSSLVPFALSRTGLRSCRSKTWRRDALPDCVVGLRSDRHSTDSSLIWSAFRGYLPLCNFVGLLFVCFHYLLGGRVELSQRPTRGGLT